MTGPPLLSVRGLSKHYPIRSGLLRRVTGHVRAVDGVDLEVHRGEVLGLVGESGCGKSTTARSILHLEEPTAGTVEFDGTQVDTHTDGERMRFRRRAQLLFQDPETSFNPRQTVGQSIAEPMEIHGLTDPDRQAAIVADRLDRVRLDPAVADRYPHEFSGGQKQRLALARALVFDPDLLIADEPVSGLDEHVQAAVLSLLDDLRAARDLAVLYISHDIRTVRRFCNRVAVMYAGEIVERGPVDRVLDEPQHPYTRSLVEAAPNPDPAARGSLATLEGEVPDPADPPDGCRFHPRCPAVIPPPAIDVDQAAFRGIVRLRTRLDDGRFDAEAARRAAAGPADRPSNVTDDRVRASIRAAHGIPSTLADDVAESALAEALDSLIAGDVQAARRRLSATFESVCEQRSPAPFETSSGTATCHRHDETVTTEPTPVD